MHVATPRTGAPPARRTALALAAAVAVLLALLPGAAAAQDPDPRQGLAPGTDATSGGNAHTVPNADAETAAVGIEHLANRPKPAWSIGGVETAAAAFNYANIGSDLAFVGDKAISGNYRGWGVYDVSDPAAPVLETVVNCPGGQGDVSVHGGLLFMSVESSSARVDCSTDSAQPIFRGVRIWDISDLSDPQYVAAVQTCRGSHTHTVVEDPADPATVYIYVSGTSFVRPAEQMAGCTDPSGSNEAADYLDQDGNPIPTSRFQVEVIAVPVDAPQDAAIVDEAHLMADPATGSPAGLWPGGVVGPDGPGGDRAVQGPRPGGPGYQSTAAADACHDITAYPEIGLAAGACEGNGILIDITDPARPVRLAEVSDPNFAYWHSATFSNDGSTVVFTDEWGGGVQARCQPTDPEQWGANAIFDIVQTDQGPTLEFASYYSIPNVQEWNETCVAHNGNLVPVPGRDVMVQAWYEGGLSVFDFTDSANPTEIAFFDRGPYHPDEFHQGGYWSVYWHNGQIYGNEIFLGFDSFGLTPSAHLSEAELAVARSWTVVDGNAQAQERYAFQPSFLLVEATRDQAVRAGLSGALLADVDSTLARAEQQVAGAPRTAINALRGLADRLEADGGFAALVQALRDLAGSIPPGPAPTQPTPTPTPTPTEPGYGPVEATDDVVETAVAVSQHRFPDTAAFAQADAAYAVVARDDVFADAMSASVLLGDGSLLFTGGGALDERTAAEVERLAVDTVYLMGGEQALSAEVARELADLGVEVVRLAGASRVETAIAVAGEALATGSADGSEVALARAYGTAGDETAAWVDSFTGGAHAAAAAVPVLLTPGEGLHPAVEAFLDDRGFDSTVLLGGTAALGDAVADAVGGATRVAGDNRAGTAVAVARDLLGVQPEGPRSYIVVDGTDEAAWAYGLLAAGLSADGGGPLLLTGGGTIPPETLAEVTGCGDQVSLSSLGDPAVVTADLLAELDAADAEACG